MLFRAVSRGALGMSKKMPGSLPAWQDSFGAPPLECWEGLMAELALWLLVLCKAIHFGQKPGGWRLRATAGAPWG